ncbi:hypothetical protein BWI17_07140 [Betaproteobacteria bacterium GR16-43]|nr:hypothetical protein BWI17_07140 [Betaproteobacteria bacterium GR16-43]
MFAALTTAALPAAAVITEISVLSREPYGEFAAGKFVKVEVEARGTLSPTEKIPGLDKAPRNAAGLVGYKVPVTLIIPEMPTGGNGTLIVDVPNRGRAVSHGLYNSPRARPIAVGSLDQGIGFLQDRGYSLAVVQWELGEGPALPMFESGGKKLYAEGVGFAAVRDVALFLRRDSYERVYGLGYSQTARFLKSFLVNGFNEVDGAIVFDALHVVNAAAGGMPLLDAGPGPTSVASETPGHTNAEHRGVHEEPFTYGEVMKVAGAKYKKLPLVMVNHTYNDYMGGRAALTRTGTKGTTDLPIPDNVRMYDIAGAPHTMSRTKNADCVEGQGQLDWAPALRAQLVALDQWVKGKAAPPANKLFALEARPTDPEVFQAPKYLSGAVVMVPKLDRDHNPNSGVQLPDILVPIASHGYMNSPLSVMACRQAGTYRPFVKEVLEARYPGGINEYMGKMRLAVQQLVAERVLLEEDAVVIVNAAAENPSFVPTRPRARGATTRN